MVRRRTEEPDGVRPFTFHGLDLTLNGGQATGNCPWCDGEGHFSVEVDTTKWRCWKCNEQGNARVFIRKLWALSDQTVDMTAFKELAEDRSLLEPDTLFHWGLVRSAITGRWMVPCYGASGEIQQLVCYTDPVGGKGRMLLATPTLPIEMFMVERKFKKRVFVCEGPWDAMALWEILGRTKQTENGLAPTANSSASLLGSSSVAAIPGCMVFQERWREAFAGRDVIFMFDSDHPRTAKTGQTPPSGFAGVLRSERILRSGPEKTHPRSVSFLQWGPDGYDPQRASGYDVRDHLREGKTVADRIPRLAELLSKVVPVEEQLEAEGSSGAGRPRQLQCKQCRSYVKLVNTWRKALRWTDGLDHALAVMLASIASTKTLGDQLWVKVIGPAACAKSTLCEALSVAKKYVVAKSTIRGFHSGYYDPDSGKDHSLVSSLRDKTLVIKDGDTLLQSPNLPQILSEGRDIYDGTSRTSYRNPMSRDYENLRLTFILCGTSSLRSIDSSELGERFLDCVIMQGIDDELEDEILWRVANRAERSLSFSTDGKAETHYEPDLAVAMQLTGGYVEWLREHAADELSQIDMPPEAKHRCTRLGKFVAFMRARPSKHQAENAEREFATRLVSQLTRLAKCLALVLNRKTVDAPVMARVARVAMDTGRGQTMDIVVQLHKHGEGLTITTLSALCGQTEDRCRQLTRFLRALGCVEVYTPEPVKGVQTRPHWVLSQKIRRLYSEVMTQSSAAEAQEVKDPGVL